MKKMRKIIPALAMLLVSAIMMSTASFAWFTMSTTATADGMKVRATTSGGLAIAFATPTQTGHDAPSDDVFQSSATFDEDANWSNGAYKLSPTSTDLNGSKWYTAASATLSSSAALTGSYAEVGADNASGYYFMTTLYVKSLDESADTAGKDLYVDMITPSGSSHNLEKSLRVAINVGDTWLFFAPHYDTLPAGGLKYVSAISGEGEGQVATVLANSTTMFIGDDAQTGAQLLDGGLGYTVPTEVNVYIYFEGEDVNCRSDYAYDLSDLGIAITFTSVD